MLHTEKLYGIAPKSFFGAPSVLPPLFFPRNETGLKPRSYVEQPCKINQQSQKLPVARCCGTQIINANMLHRIASRPTEGHCNNTLIPTRMLPPHLRASENLHKEQGGWGNSTNYSRQKNKIMTFCHWTRPQSLTRSSTHLAGVLSAQNQHQDIL